MNESPRPKKKPVRTGSILSRSNIDREFYRPAHDASTGFIRVQCKACERWLDSKDLNFGNCPYCIEEKVKNAIDKFRPMDGLRSQFPECAECHTEIILMGMKMWDVQAKSWKLVCTNCGYAQCERDRHYRNTPWGVSRKLK